jgi:MFS family permease
MAEEASAARTDFKTFVTIWGGQFVSILGSGLTNFALSIWVLRHSHSVTQYTLAIVFTGLPGILIGPFAGALVDRWDRKMVMLAADFLPALTVLTYAALLWTDHLQVWHIYIGILFNSICATFQWPAYIAALSDIVQPKDYGRINGVIEFGQAATTIAAPAIAGWLMYAVGIDNILIVDFFTFVCAAIALLFARVPRPVVSEEGAAAKGSLWQETKFGWTFIRQRPGLFNLLLFFAVTNLVGAMCGVAIMPMVLGFANEAAVGTIMSLVGVGMLIGGLVMTATGGPKPRVYGVLGAGVVMTVCFLLIGLRPNLWIVGAGVLLWYTVIPIQNASSQAIWQSKTPGDVRGRVFAVRRMIAQFTVPIGDFSAGPLADKIFNPAMAAGGALAGTAGKVMGVGPGRGIGLMFVTMAIVPALATVWTLMNPRVRNVESELPDAKRPQAPAEPPVEAPAAATAPPVVEAAEVPESAPA